MSGRIPLSCFKDGAPEMGSKGEIHRAFTKDYESTVPKEYTKDGKDHCY